MGLRNDPQEYDATDELHEYGGDFVNLDNLAEFAAQSKHTTRTKSWHGSLLWKYHEWMLPRSVPANSDWSSELFEYAIACAEEDKGFAIAFHAMNYGHVETAEELRNLLDILGAAIVEGVDI